MLSTNTISKSVIGQQKYSITKMDHNASIIKLIEECKSESSIDRKIELLYAINAMLPKSQQLKIPSLITNDYVYQALYKIEEVLLVA